MAEWISVKDRLPEEHGSIFEAFYGTERWSNGMFRKLSDDVLVVLDYKDGVRKVTTLKTLDGNWNLSSIHGAQITHWAPLPEPPKEGEQDD